MSEEIVTGSEPLMQPRSSRCLQEAREKLGFSQKEVADKLYLTTSFIKYIDDGEFEKISKPAFVKGYLRSYARTVGLSGDEIVALYEDELAALEPTPEMKGVTEEKVGTASITGPVLQSGVIGLIVLVLIIALVWWLVADSEEAPPSVTGSVDRQEVAPEVIDEDVGDDIEEDMSDDPAVPVDEALASSEPSDVDLPPETPVQQAAETEVVDQRRGMLAEVSDEPVPSVDESDIRVERSSDGSRTFVTVDAGGFEQLELSFADECWVEVEDSRYGLIYNDLNRANDVLTIYGTAPINVLLGRATVVEMIYNGRPFALEPYMGGDRTAKFTLSDS